MKNQNSIQKMIKNELSIKNKINILINIWLFASFMNLTNNQMIIALPPIIIVAIIVMNLIKIFISQNKKYDKFKEYTNLKLNEYTLKCMLILLLCIIIFLVSTITNKIIIFNSITSIIIIFDFTIMEKIKNIINNNH